MRGATDYRFERVWRYPISTHTPHTGRDRTGHNAYELANISTHTPHTGRDPVFRCIARIAYISTHTPHTGRDFGIKELSQKDGEFQLTRPIRGATGFPAIFAASATFQLTRPMRGATQPLSEKCSAEIISTHTPLAGRDCSTVINTVSATADFNSHAPCGARLWHPCSILQPMAQFQLTRPMRGATGQRLKMLCVMLFQLTRPMRGATACSTVSDII